MRAFVKSLTLVSLLGSASLTAIAQTVATAPAGTNITSPQTDPRSVALTGGKTWNYTNASWPAFTSPCYTIGYSDILASVINGYNPSPICGGLQSVTFNAASSNLANGVLVFTGITTYRYIQTSGFYVTNSNIPVRVTVTFTNGSAAPVAVQSNNGFKFIRADQNFNVHAIIEAFSPAGALYFAGGPNTWTPAITLFNNLHTDPNSIICTSFSAPSFMTFSVTTAASNTGPYCEGESITLSSSATAEASGALTYSWTGPSFSSTAEDPAPIPNATTAMAGNYTVTVTDAIGCAGSDITAVEVNSIPVVQASASQTICEGDTATLTASGATTYTWQPGGLTGSSISVSPTATTTYTVTGTSSGCSSTATTTVTVVPAPVVSATATPATITAGNSSTLSVDNPQGGTTYSWTGTGLSQSTGTSVTASPATAGTYTYTVTADNGSCTVDAEVILTVQSGTPPCTSAMGGSYTVNPAVATGGTNFQTVADLAAALNTIGVCAPVTVNFTSGSYTGPLVLNSIAGSSSTNTITINGNGATISVCALASNQPLNLVSLNGTDNITIDGFMLTATCTYGVGVRLFNGNENVTISNNTINVLVPGPNSTSAHNAGIIALGTGDLTIDNNNITGGRRGIVVQDPTGQVTISHNTLTEAYEYGVGIVNADGLVLYKNAIALRASSFASVGVQASSINGFTFDSNYITNARRNGIAINSSNVGISAAQSQIINNRIGKYQAGTAFASGIFLYDVSMVDVDHNSIWLDGGTSGAALFAGGTTSMNVRNNIFANATVGSSWAMYAYLHNILSMSHNNFYSPSGNFVFLSQDVPTLADLNLLGHGTGSLSVNPLFTSDMHTGNSALRDAGTPTVIVQFDFEGDERGSATFGRSDIGADEMTSPAPRYASTAGAKVDAQVYPNPFSSELTLTLSGMQAGQVQVLVTDLMGRQVYSHSYQAEPGVTTLQVQPKQQLAQGVYMLQVSQGDAVSTFRVVKQ